MTDALILTQYPSIAADLVSACKRSGVASSLLTLAGTKNGTGDRKPRKERRERVEAVVQIGLRTP